MHMYFMVIKGFNLIFPVENVAKYLKIWSNILNILYCINVKRNKILEIKNCKVNMRINLVSCVFVVCSY